MKNILKRTALIMMCAMLGAAASGCDGDKNGGATPTVGVATADAVAAYDNDKSGFIRVSAWNFPTLDPTNDYDNEKNAALAADIKAAGIHTIFIAGGNSFPPNSADNLRKIRKQIEVFNRYGIETAVFGSNAGGWDNEQCDFSDNALGFPDFSDCEGLRGFMPWDEPTKADIITKLGLYAVKFNELYRGSDAVFMVNLLPSYGAHFFKEEFDFEAYLKYYCDEVLTKVEGTKWLALDNYPIYADYTLGSTFLHDMAMLKKYSDEYGAVSHICLQTGAWPNSLNTRVPNREEFSLQVYAALAFGMDEYSMYTITHEDPSLKGWAPMDGDGAKNAAYESCKSVNEEIASFAHVYKQFKWKGAVLNQADGESSAYSQVTKNKSLKDIVLTAEDIGSVKSITADKNFIMGVFEDKNGNEGFVLTNYTAPQSKKKSTVTIEFNGADALMVYAGGEKKTIELVGGKAEFTLEAGDGVFFVPYKSK